MAFGSECCCAAEEDVASSDMIQYISCVDEQVAHMTWNTRGEMALGRRAFVDAVRRDDAPSVLQLVAEGAKEEDMSEALRLACHSGSLAVVRELVGLGLSVNESCLQTGVTPIHLAAAGGHHTVCEVLLDAMADVHRVVRNITAQTLARKSGHVEVDEMITNHIAALVAEEGCGQGPDASAASNRRAHVLPRVSPFLSEAVLQAVLTRSTPDGAASVCAASQHDVPPVTDVSGETPHIERPIQAEAL